MFYQPLKVVLGLFRLYIYNPNMGGGQILTCYSVSDVLFLQILLMSFFLTYIYIYVIYI